MVTTQKRPTTGSSKIRKCLCCVSGVNHLGAGERHSRSLLLPSEEKPMHCEEEGDETNAGDFHVLIPPVVPRTARGALPCREPYGVPGAGASQRCPPAQDAVGAVGGEGVGRPEPARGALCDSYSQRRGLCRAAAHPSHRREHCRRARRVVARDGTPVRPLGTGTPGTRCLWVCAQDHGALRLVE